MRMILALLPIFRWWVTALLPLHAVKRIARYATDWYAHSFFCVVMFPVMSMTIKFLLIQLIEERLKPNPIKFRNVSLVETIYIQTWSSLVLACIVFLALGGTLPYVFAIFGLLITLNTLTQLFLFQFDGIPETQCMILGDTRARRLS